jgi:hypothetical protein
LKEVSTSFRYRKCLHPIAGRSASIAASGLSGVMMVYKLIAERMLAVISDPSLAKNIVTTTATCPYFFINKGSK